MTALKAKDTSTIMTPSEARHIIANELRWTQIETAQALGVSLRTVQWYISATRREIPGPVALLLRYWCDYPNLWPTFLKKKKGLE